MSNNALIVKRERDWMDWVQTGSAAYSAHSLGVMARAVEAEQAQKVAEAWRAFVAEAKNLPAGIASLPEGLQRIAMEAQTDAQWHVRAISLGRGNSADNWDKVGENIAFKQDCLYREEATKALASQAGRPLYNLYDSLLMYRETMDSEFRRASDPWDDSNLRFTAESANRLQLHCFRSTLPADQQRDFWDWQRFMMSRHYMRELRAVAADNARRSEDVIRRRGATNAGAVISVLSAFTLSLFVIPAVGKSFGLSSTSNVFLWLLLVPFVLGFLLLVILPVVAAVLNASVKVHAKPVFVVSQLDGSAEKLRVDVNDTCHTPEIARQIGWLTAAGYLDPGSEPGNLDMDEMRRRMQEEAAHWRRKPIMQAYVVARRAFFREFSAAGERRKFAKSFQDFAMRMVPEDVEKVLKEGFPIGDAKYMPPSPARDMALKYAESLRNLARL